MAFLIKSPSGEEGLVENQPALGKQWYHGQWRESRHVLGTRMEPLEVVR